MTKISLAERKQEFKILFRRILNSSESILDFETKINDFYPGNLWVINIDWNESGQLSTGKIFLVTRNDDNYIHTCCIEF